MADIGKTVFGFPVREPESGENDFFGKNPTVAGMATDDGAIILNPYSTLSQREKNAVLLNEASRLLLKQTGVPKFEVTDQQRQFFADLAARGIPAEQSDDDIRATLIGRIISGDPSAKDVTDDQRRVASAVAARLRALRQNDQR